VRFKSGREPWFVLVVILVSRKERQFENEGDDEEAILYPLLIVPRVACCVLRELVEGFRNT